MNGGGVRKIRRTKIPTADSNSANPSERQNKPQTEDLGPPSVSEKQIQYVSVKNLFFDPDNPRLPTTIAKKDTDAVVEWMLRDASITELMGSIGEKGFFRGEPLLVVPTQRQDGTYFVVEGNRRLCAVKLLLDSELAPVRKNAVKAVASDAVFRPAELPVLIYRDRSEILGYLGFRHVTGIKQWNPLQKARYVRQLAESMEGPLATKKHSAIAKIIGSRADYVASLLTSLAVYERITANDFFDIKSIKSEEDIDFSVLTTALSYSNILDFLRLKSRTDPLIEGILEDRLKELTGWLFEKVSEGRTRLGESRNLKILNRVVESKKALEKFRLGIPLAEADMFTGAPEEIFRKSILEAREKLSAARTHQHLVEKPMQADLDVVAEIARMAKDIRTLINARLSDEEM